MVEYLQGLYIFNSKCWFLHSVNETIAIISYMLTVENYDHLQTYVFAETLKISIYIQYVPEYFIRLFKQSFQSQHAKSFRRMITDNQQTLILGLKKCYCHIEIRKYAAVK